MAKKITPKYKKQEAIHRVARRVYDVKGVKIDAFKSLDTKSAYAVTLALLKELNRMGCLKNIVKD